MFSLNKRSNQKKTQELNYRSNKCLSTHVCDILSLSSISRVVLHWLFSIIAFILSSSTSVGRPERGASLRSKSPERKRVNQFRHTIYGLKFAMEKNDFERLKSSSGKKRKDLVANPI